MTFIEVFPVYRSDGDKRRYLKMIGVRLRRKVDTASAEGVKSICDSFEAIPLEISRASRDRHDASAELSRSEREARLTDPSHTIFPGGGPHERLEAICDRFEAAWRTGARPSIEDFILDVEEPLRTDLLRELILLDMEWRASSGDLSAPEDYVSRFPDHRSMVMHLSKNCPTLRPQNSGKEGFPEMPDPVVLATSRYSSLRYHARGGLGEVFQAHDQELQRRVAIKFIQEAHSDDEEAHQRFLLEAEVTGRLDHPGIVPIYGMGKLPDGRPFYSMRFIEGSSLHEAIGDYHRNAASLDHHARRIELHRLVTHLVTVCNIIAYAHNRGVVHRDIKPDNVMIGKFGETIVVDWGLATPIARDDRARASGEKSLMAPSGDRPSQAGGTPGYASPEQWTTSDLTPQSDIYSLGAVLHRILTGKTPNAPSTAKGVINPPPKETLSPETPKPRVPRALDAICKKALAVDRRDRYATATEMAKDLEAWMADEPVSVYREPLFERITRGARRHRSWTQSFAGVTAFVLISVIAASIWLGRMARSEQRSHELGMQVAAQFAAKTVANEIDLRWRILGEHAADGRLQQLIHSVANAPEESPDRRALNDWIERRYGETLRFTRATSWFLTDSEGNQIARYPRSEKTIGENFKTRDYFNGGNPDLKPITDVHLSSVYRSKGDGFEKFAFTVPVWSGGSEKTGDVIGVLGMSVELGKFAVLKTNAEQFPVLIDMREDTLEETPRTGLILHHPNLTDARRRSLRQGNSIFLRVSPELIPKFKTLIANRIEQDELLGEDKTSSEFSGLFVRDYIDPIAAEPTAVKAAFEPVVIDGRQADDVRYTGLVVGVQEVVD